MVEEIVPEPEEKASEKKLKVGKDDEAAKADEEKPYTGPDSDKDEAKTEDQDATAEETEEESLPEAPKEVEYRTYIKPHTFEVKINEKLNKVRTLDQESFIASKKRIRSLEKRDENLMTKLQAKNFFETQIYELR